ncbi:protein U [Advenella kashmirensis W13003]|uniref:Protein U n=1 Tax=Advenella kashmirensis W13003 TaxID=1424334 RepID=V8QWP9_9BURK|nr:spore coat U domain-containing protein [Advenella kashmirensis]ETF04366.1 protein U [Advenella kashmirensis W13003]
MRAKVAILFAGLIVAVSPMQAHAATDTTQFDVTISIEPSCNISTGDNGVSTLAFGSHDSFQTNVAGQTNLTVTCTNGADYDLGLDAGQHASTPDDVNTRRMQGISTTPDNQSDYVPYQLYQDSARSDVWGNTIDTNTLQSTGTGAVQTHVIYGQVPSTNYTVGDYQDTVTATVTF